MSRIRELIERGEEIGAMLGASRNGVPIGIPELTHALQELRAINSEFEAICDANEWQSATYHRMRPNSQWLPFLGSST